MPTAAAHPPFGEQYTKNEGRDRNPATPLTYDNILTCR